MNIVFSIQGGIGKSVMATAVCRAIKKQYPNSNLIIITGYPEVFSGLETVDMVYNHGQEHFFYTKYIQNQEFKILANEPYLETNHIAGTEHVIQTWCAMAGVPYNGEQPEISLNEREMRFFSNKYVFEKPILILQTSGGGPTDIKYSWARDMPRNVALSVINEFKEKYEILHIRREDQLQYPFTKPIHDSYKGISALIAMSEKRVLIDSFCQHTAAALGKKSTVLWICNRPNVFGYNLHDNIKANPETRKPDLKFSMYHKYNISGDLNEFPYQSEMDIFSADRIIASVLNQ